ncbi:zinc finger BED domain-containing protein RICESLEEPER 2-like [Argentina anserina]|uniref:zinc finger BED domain-containing protein RICESLEEPER 2-like n=1 Tax=Argentina anserina TaxID=57926 RepID=UPI0021766CCB|nr:zinc finger BED domain-containing protein RICESLEEPER 2-like [Potentilla anserina]
MGESATATPTPIHDPAPSPTPTHTQASSVGNMVVDLEKEEESEETYLARLKEKEGLRHVEGDGFKYFVSRLNPDCVAPSHKTIAKLVFKRYLAEKENLKKMLSRYRVYLTTDTWTLVQNIYYIVITAHFIDDNWLLHKKINNFSAIHNHKGETIAVVLESCLQEWGIDKLLTITVDNASANDVEIRDLIRMMNSWGIQMSLCMKAKFANELIRSAVRYVRSSPQRLDNFNMWKEMMKIDGKLGVIMDVPTRWNSTYLMLRSSYKFHKVIDMMFCDDPNAISFFDDTTPSIPSSFDWEEAQGYMDFLKPFYVVTLKVCCSHYPSIHDIFGGLLRTKCLLEAQVNPNLSWIREPMTKKYNKYWGDLDKLNKYIFIAIVLDPRYKFERVVDYFEILFGEMDERVEVNSNMVKDLLYDIYKVYEEDGGFSVGGSQVSNEGNVGSSTSMEGLIEFDKLLKEK